MEKEYYTGEFEQFVKERADQFSMYPSKRVWHSIYNNLHPSRRWPSVFMSLFLVSSLMLIGYLHTGENSISPQINNHAPVNKTEEIQITQTESNNKAIASVPKKQTQAVSYFDNAFADVITNETDFYTYTIVKSNRPTYIFSTSADAAKITADKMPGDNNDKDILQSMDAYIKSGKIFTDIAVTGKKNKSGTSIPAAKKTGTDKLTAGELKSDTPDEPALLVINNSNNPDIINVPVADKTINAITSTAEEKNTPVTAEKSWIENFAFHNKPAGNKWKGRLAYQFYATPAVNYRKLSSQTKGSTSAFATADINNVISQKPGFGFEAGAGLTYSVAKKLQLKAGLQFNYTNYNIDADKTSHPIITTILLNDPSTGYSYSAARTSTTANIYNSSALQPVTLHNRTYQISLPVGLAYKLSSQANVDWFAGASVQPTYVFGGNAHIISSDLKSYVSDPSSISTWNLNLGFETYMNFKLGGYQLQVGPQVRYQVYSTYRKNVALIEKPYAVGLKLGLSKGF
ncbi:MAG: outer membrane beta-barrel protein [Ferruginibacter sp.]